MNIQMIGIDHTKAPLDVRQVFAFTKKAMEQAYGWLREQPGISGCVLLSTCNRMELWLNCEEEFEQSACQVLCQLKGVELAQYQHYFVARKNHQAVEHLFSLAAGLKSQILGEDQILTQVKEAAAFAREQYCTDQVLEVLFRMAVTGGKKVKTLVPIHKANFSAAHEAMEALESQGYSLAHKTCLVIGNGEMGRVTANALREAGADVTMTVRQYRSGQLLIPEGCNRMNYGERYQYIPRCDMIVSATASPNFTITKKDLEQVLDRDHPRQQIYIDLAVPRDMEQSIEELPGVTRYDIDSFQIQAASETMRRQVAEAEQILSQQQEEFYNWYDGRNLVPQIQEISREAAADVAWRARRTTGTLHLEEEAGKTLESGIEEAAQKVVAKLLFRLRDSMSTDQFRECLDILEGEQK